MTNRWAVELKGTEADLQYWRDALKPEFDPFVSDRKCGDRILLALEAKKFQGAVNSIELMDIADVLIRVVNGVFFSDGNPTDVIAGRALEILPDGSIRSHYVIRAGTCEIFLPRVRVNGVGQAIDSEGNLIIQPREPSFVQKAIALAERHLLLQEALIELSPTSDWHSLYRVFEMLMANSATKQLRSTNKRKRFSRSANTNGTRHRLKPEEKFDNPQSIMDARVFIADWLADALRL